MPLHPEHQRRKGRNIALAGILLLLAALFFVVTVAKISGNIEASRSEKTDG